MTTLTSADAVAVPIAELYDAHADWYDALCEDRDVAAQVAAAIELWAPSATPVRTLELFAGPAYHSGVIARRTGADTVCVDAAEAMRRVAVERGRCDPDRYIVGMLPAALTVLDGAFDIVLAMRYSVGYLSRSDLRATLSHLRRLMRPGSLLLVELHDMSLVSQSLEHLAIRQRQATRDGVTATCWWPASALRWHSSDWCADMDVQVRWTDARGVAISERRFISTERIYSQEDVCDAARVVGGFECVASDPRHGVVFPGAVLAALRRTDHV